MRHNTAGRNARSAALLVGSTPSVVTNVHNAGQSATITDQRGTTQYQYDELDQLTSITTPNGSSLSYTYDAASNRQSMTSPAGTTRYAYDAAGRLQQVTDPWGGSSSYSYDAVGNRTGLTLPNGITVSYTYDQLDRLTQITQRKGETVLAAYDYTLSPTGNRLGLTEANGRTTQWTYDAADRLLSETRQAAGGETVQSAYTYDAAGNRLSKTVDGQTTSYTYNELDQLVSAGSAQYSYDARGNLVTVTDGQQVTRYSYDARDRLSAATLPDGRTAQYTYDADGRRVRQEANGTITQYLWDEASRYGDVVLETDQAGAPQASYVLGGTELLAQRRGIQTSYYLHDADGSVRALSTPSGAISDEYLYDAFGQLLEHSGTTANSYLYTGQQFDALTGLYNLRARYYNPSDGRFLTRDTALVDRFSPTELNRYSYVGNNPVNLVDWSGHEGTVGYGLGVLQGAKRGAMIGAVGGFALSAFTYYAARLGWCGNPMAEWALQTNPFLFIAGGTLLGAGFGLVFGGLAELGPAFALSAALIGGVFSVAALAHAAGDILHNGANACNSVEFISGFVGAGLSGLEGAKAMGVLIRGLRAPVGPSGPPPTNPPGPTGPPDAPPTGPTNPPDAPPTGPTNPPDAPPTGPTNPPGPTNPSDPGGDLSNPGGPDSPGGPGGPGNPGGLGGSSGGGSGGRSPIFADNNLLIAAAERNHTGALAEIRAGKTYITSNQYNEFMNVNSSAQQNARQAFLRAEGIEVFDGPEAGRLASLPELQRVFQMVEPQQGRNDAALAAFAKVTGYEAVTMESRLFNFLTNTLRQLFVPIRRIR